MVLGDLGRHRAVADGVAAPVAAGDGRDSLAPGWREGEPAHHGRRCAELGRRVAGHVVDECRGGAAGADAIGAFQRPGGAVLAQDGGQHHPHRLVGGGRVVGPFGVGIGLGLQKLAANYVSGFVVLAERSVRIGDMVSVDGFEGRITDIKTRYTVIRALNGRESIVPNEVLLTQRIENSSLADPKVVQRTSVTVAYGTGLSSLSPLMVQAVAAVPRVLSEPPPAVHLDAFGPDGLELIVSFWIEDPENGSGNVKSDVNLALLTVLNGQGVVIPYPQREMRWSGPPPASTP
ncbi:MAG: hypothetical protein EBT96_02085 [Betaproteobacteria bacterium]|nr:hypothetical protein [Betaproteobacteria bacterium]